MQASARSYDHSPAPESTATVESTIGPTLSAVLRKCTTAKLSCLNVLETRVTMRAIISVLHQCFVALGAQHAFETGVQQR